MDKLLVICGPTATGKTTLAVSLAKKFDAEIISADSRQVYKGMDIATGKDLPKQAKVKKDVQTGLDYYLFDSIPVWLLDVVRLNEEFSVANFVDLAGRVLGRIWTKGKLPIVVGGTGFYIKALVDGIQTLGISPDWTLRKQLETRSWQELFEMLARLDSEKAASMNVSDRQNKRRLVRAIEVALAKNHMGKTKLKKEIRKKRHINPLFIGLKAPMKDLYERIDRRINRQLEEGAKREVESLLNQGYSWELPAMTALGYRQWQKYFKEGESIEKVMSLWKSGEHDYARRQMIWFEKERRINWFDITKVGFGKEVEKKVRSWYPKKG